VVKLLEVLGLQLLGVRDELGDEQVELLRLALEVVGDLLPDPLQLEESGAERVCEGFFFEVVLVVSGGGDEACGFAGRGLGVGLEEALDVLR